MGIRFLSMLYGYSKKVKQTKLTPKTAATSVTLEKSIYILDEFNIGGPTCLRMGK